MAKELSLREMMGRRAHIDNPNLLTQVKPENMRRYAEQRGFHFQEDWIQEGRLVGYIHRYRELSDDSLPLDVVILADPTTSDYPLRVEDFIQAMVTMADSDGENLTGNKVLDALVIGQ